MYLVLDRNPVFRQGMSCVINIFNKSAAVVQAGTIAEAITLLQRGNIEALFCDVRLKNECGLDLVRMIKDTLYPVKTFFLTESMRKADFQEAVNMDVDAYMKKDADIDEIHYAMKIVASGRKYYSSDFVNMFKLFEEGPKTPFSLTDREKDVLVMLCTGLSNADISSRLSISEGTTKKHVSNILGKLGVANRVEAVVYASKHRSILGNAFSRLEGLGLSDERMSVNA